ncbi:hypothetical protein HXX76_014996 [Chlamydomonas incerta]|uniref:Uncharacterized protein n=1 Tax=Chlamydomonas incerta TaxID=51695 RepID=A0A835VSI9_CHLIN|nr:hypothetical protein HXX76_014996 [Chlamydomonas incerta]|eukprot:KAG2423836.1 hypothetical protein HXX76_014996 [Chlamydomonas incerta]
MGSGDAGAGVCVWRCRTRAQKRRRPQQQSLSERLVPPRSSAAWAEDSGFGGHLRQLQTSQPKRPSLNGRSTPGASPPRQPLQVQQQKQLQQQTHVVANVGSSERGAVNGGAAGADGGRGHTARNGGSGLNGGASANASANGTVGGPVLPVAVSSNPEPAAAGSGPAAAAIAGTAALAEPSGRRVWDPPQITHMIKGCGNWRELREAVRVFQGSLNAVHGTAVVTRLTHLAAPSAPAEHREWLAFVGEVVALVEALAGSLDARGVANISWALAKLVSAAAAAAAAEAQQAQQQSQRQQDAAAAASALLSATRRTVSSLLSLPAASPSSSNARTTSTGASRSPAGSGMLPQHLANGLWAAAALGLSPDDAGDWPLRALAAARPLLSAGAFTEEGLSQLAWAAAELGVVPDEDWARRYYGAAGRLARAMSPHNSSNILYALARLASDSDAEGSDSAVQAAAVAAPGRRLAPPSAAWLSHFLDATAPRLEASGDALALANGVWALAVMQGSVGQEAGAGLVVTRRWLRACYAALQGAGQPQQQGAHAQARQGPALGGAWVVERLSDKDVSRVLWGLARLHEDAMAEGLAGVGSQRVPQPPAGLLVAAERRLLGRATGLSAMHDQSFAMASWGLARLQQLQQQQQQARIERQGQARQGADSWQAAWLDSATMRLGSMPVQGLLLTLRAASAWGVTLQPAAAASGRGQAAAGPAASAAAAAAKRFLAAATAAALLPRHAHLRPRLLLALLDVGKAMSVLPVSAASADVASSTPGEEEEASPGAAAVAAGRALLEVVAGELHAAAAAPPARKPASSGAVQGAPVWDATSLLRCGAAMAEVGYVPPPWWRQTFFGRVVALAGLTPSSSAPAAPSNPPAAATAAAGSSTVSTDDAAGARPPLAAEAFAAAGTKVGDGAPHNLGAGDVLLLLTCSQAWSATASDATLGGLLYGVPYGGWQPHVAAEVCRLLAAQEQQRAAAARQQRYAVQRQQLAAAAAAAAAARAGNSMAAAALAEAEPILDDSDGRSVAFSSQRRLNGALNGAAAGHPRHALNGDAEGQAWREDGLGSGDGVSGSESGSGSRHHVSLQRGPGRPMAVAAARAAADGPSALSTWPGDSSGDSDSDGAMAAASAAAAAAAAAGAVAVAVPGFSEGRVAVPPAAAAASASVAEADSSAAPQMLKASPVGRRTPAYRFVQQVVGIACTSLATYRSGGGAQGTGTGGAGASAAAPLDAPWTPRSLCVLLQAAHTLGLQLSRGQRRALAAGLAHHLNAVATAPAASASAASTASASASGTGVSPAADLVPLLWAMCRLGVTPAMLGSGGRAALVAALARSAALQPDGLEDWQLFMLLEVMRAWRVVPPPAWAQRAPQRLVAWLQGSAPRSAESAAAPVGMAQARAVDMLLLLTAVRSVQYLRDAAAAAAAIAAAAAAAAAPPAQGSQQPAGAAAPGSAAASPAALAPPSAAAFDDHVWPQLWPALRTAVRLQLPSLFALPPSAIPTCGALPPHIADGAAAASAAPAAALAPAPARERLAALLAGAQLGLLTYEDWTGWAVVELRALAHDLPPPLYPAWLRAAAAARQHFPRSAHEDTLVAFCLASGPRLQALPPSLLHATLLAAGRAARALRTQLSPDWASEGLRRYSRCPDALPPGQLAQVLGVLRLLGRVPPPRWQLAYAGVVRQALPRMDQAAAAGMLRDAAAMSPELEGLLRGIVGEHVAAVARARRLQQEQMQQQMLLAQQQALQGQGQLEGQLQGQEARRTVTLNGAGAGLPHQQSRTDIDV